MALINRCVWWIIKAIRPLVGYAECRYLVTCTQFAEYQLKEKSLIPAMWAIAKRVLSCNPLF